MSILEEFGVRTWMGNIKPVTFRDTGTDKLFTQMLGAV